MNGLKPRLIGAILDEDVLDPKSGRVLLVKGRILTAEDTALLNHRLIQSVTVIPAYQEGAETPAAETIDLGAAAAAEELVSSLRHFMAETPAAETIDLGAAAAVEELVSSLRHFMNTRLHGKHLDAPAVTRDGEELFPAGTEITEPVADRILAADVPEIRIHMDEVEGHPDRAERRRHRDAGRPHHRPLSGR